MAERGILLRTHISRQPQRSLNLYAEATRPPDQGDQEAALYQHEHRGLPMLEQQGQAPPRARTCDLQSRTGASLVRKTRKRAAIAQNRINVLGVDVFGDAKFFTFVI